MKKRIVITGLGVLASNGQGRTDFWQGLKEGRVGYRPITLFETDDLLARQAGEITDFDAKQYLGPKGLRNMDRSTRLVVSAGRLAVADSGLVITEEHTDQFGVAVGTTFGSLKSIVDFDEVILREGPRYTNPALFPNTVINSPASQVSIWQNIQGFNSTISTGFTASLDAMKYACDFIELDRVQAVLTGGVEELCFPTFLGFHSLQFLSGSKTGEPFVNCPFDQRRNGITFGEGACLMAMEDHDYARRRGAAVLAEVAGFGYYFHPYRIGKYHPTGIGMRRAMQGALEDAGLQSSDIGCICANANSTQAADKIETAAIKEVFGAHARQIPVSAVKSMFGETYSVSGALATAAGIGILQGDFIPPTVNYQVPDPDCDLDVVPNHGRAARVEHVLVNNFSPTGSHACVILRRYHV